MLYYCEKCGGLSVLDFNVCVQCGSHNSFKIVPSEYVDDYAIKDSLKEQFIETIVKSSPNFDQSAWDRRVGYQDVRKHQDKIIKSHIEEQSHQPECPTCHSKNVQRVSGLERGASIIGLGIFSKKINKSFKCKNCGHTW